MNRRDVLKTVAFGLPAVTALGSRIFAKVPAASVKITTLNMIVEGPFLCLLQNDQTEIIAPRVEKHRYLIEQSSAEEGTYVLGGVRGVNDTQQIGYVLPEGAEAFRLSLDQLHLSLSRNNAAYFSFKVPLPRQIVAVSSRPAEIVDGFGQRRRVTMPTAYAFVYDVANLHQLRLHGNNEWNPETRLAKETVVNLSIATGLPLGVQDPNGEHFHMALTAFRTYLPGLKLDITSVGAERQTAELKGYPGVTPRSSVLDCHMPPILVPMPMPKPPRAAS
ncbi:MAG TPA: hypothetical protein VI685_08980 [Candidatus Angelobacter sp.]